MKLITRIINRIAAILRTPQAEWSVIAEEKYQDEYDAARSAGEDAPRIKDKGGASALLICYLAGLALVPAISRFVGASLVGGYAPILPSLGGALVIYLSTFAIVYVLALVINAMAPRFGAEKNFARALKLTIYSATPIWLAGIFLLVPGLSFLVIFGLYAIYLLFAGMPILMRVPPQRALSYTGVVTACGLALVFGFALLEAPLFSPAG